jgi:hypothetical protein
MNAQKNMGKKRSFVKGSGDVDALEKIRNLEGDPVMVGFLREVFNHELDQGENALFAYKDLYRNLVARVAEAATPTSSDVEK